MRVLETDPSILYKMGKNKKHRIRKAKENDIDESSDDGIGCSHITKAVNINVMRKALGKTSVSIDECSDCVRDGPKSVTRDLFGGVVEGTAPVTDGDDAEHVIETSVCVCLQCGHQGCDRNSPNKHALKHYKTPHSGLHCIIVNLVTWSTWCYICDDVVPVNPRIQACIDYLQKMCGVRPSRPDLPLSSTVRATDTVLSDTSSPPVNSPSSKPSNTVSCAKVKGLCNLGNTCFFNAVMQSMCQTRGLESLLVERSKQEKITILGPTPGFETDGSSSENEKDEECFDKLTPLATIQAVGGEPGPVTQALLGFMQEMKGGSSKNGTVNPTALFTQVCKKAPRFKGFQQQDSHELLRYLIDSIRTEEIKKGQGSILKYYKLSETVNPKKVDEETKLKIKQYGRQVKHTFLDSVYGGQLVSTVRCEECKNISQIYEAYLDLSLPVMEEKPQRPSLVLIGKKKDSTSLGDDGDAVSMTASNTGFDSHNSRQSKYHEKKNKKNAKKDAKKKARSQKSKSLSLSQFMNQDENNEEAAADQDNASEDSSSKAIDGHDSGDGNTCNKVAETTSQKGGGKAGKADDAENNQELDSKDRGATGFGMNSSPEGSKDGLDTNRDEGSSSKDDPSDADIEDNLEGDHSRSVVSVIQNGLRETSEISQEVTISLPAENCEMGMNSQSSSMTVSSVRDSDNVDGLVQKVQRLHLKEEERDRESHVNCDMFTVDTKVNNCSDVQSVDDRDMNVSRNCDVNTNSGKEVSSLLSRNSFDMVTSTDKVSTDNPEVTAVFNISLPKTTPQTQSLEGETNSNKSSTFKLSKADKGKVEIFEGDQKDEKRNSVEDKPCPTQNGTKSRAEYLKEAKQHSMNTLAPRYQPAPKECSVLSCLNQFTAAELLTGSNKVGCKSCTKNKLKNTVVKEKKGKETVYSNANKQYLIFRPPAVLTLHLKRFEQTGLTSRKVNRHVDFPLTLDLAPYCSSLCSGVKEGQSKVLYSLYGIVEHSGRLNGGHYTAYVKLRPGVTSHTQFLNITPPGHLDILNIYLERVLKTRPHGCGESSGVKSSDGSDAVDKDIESRVESLVQPGRWFHISDSRVNEVSEASVLKAQAYLLFYERIF